MNDDINNLPKVIPDNSEKIVEKLAYRKAVKAMNGNGRWSLIQDIAQEIQADHIAAAQPLPSTKELTKEIIVRVEKKYAGEDEETVETRTLLLNSIPTETSVYRWSKQEGWEQAVWNKIKDDNIFSKERRAKMILALYQRGLEKDTVAAKLYLTMSGDYSDRPPDEKNAVVDTFREINRILHKK